MKFCSVVSDLVDADDALDVVVESVRGELGGAVDVAFVFLTADHVEQADEIVEKIWLELDPSAVVGCSAEGVIGADREIERTSGISVLAGRWPAGTRAHPFHIRRDEWQAVLHNPATLAEKIGYGTQSRGVFAFGDPYTTPLNQFFPALESLAPGVPLIGGMASSGRNLGENRLIHNDSVHNEGLVGLTISGAIDVETIVSQGCRPIGKPFVITKSQKNVIETLGGRAALIAIREVVNELSEADQSLLQHGLLIGRVIDEYREGFARGDFLVRNIIGADDDKGSIAVADLVRTGQTVQFHVRDRATAEEDLALMLAGPAGTSAAMAGLLFSCNGRGCRMFGSPNHDITAARSAMPQTPFAGFFAAGELGPIGNRNFIHGQTASFALLRVREPE